MSSKSRWGRGRNLDVETHVDPMFPSRRVLRGSVPTAVSSTVGALGTRRVSRLAVSHESVGNRLLMRHRLPFFPGGDEGLFAHRAPCGLEVPLIDLLHQSERTTQRLGSSPQSGRPEVLTLEAGEPC